MNRNECITVEVRGEVDMLRAPDLAARIRAAMMNAADSVVLEMDETTTLSSADLLGFLKTSARHMQERGGRLRIRGARGKVRALLGLAKLEALVEE